MRILAVDPGEKNIGIAISDTTGTIAKPLKVLKHVARQKDAAAIIQLAVEHGAQQIIVGQSIDEDGQPTFQGRRAARLAGAIRAQSEMPVELWDEYMSTQKAQKARLAMGTPRAKRSGHLDELAAAIILQSYLDAQDSDQ
jgi:putative Holliday junction resolvase